MSWEFEIATQGHGVGWALKRTPRQPLEQGRAARLTEGRLFPGKLSRVAGARG